MPSAHEKQKDDPPSMTCLDCGCSLEDLKKWQCPQCGRPFNPGNIATYQEARRHGALSRYIKFDYAFGLIVLCLYLPLSPILFVTSGSNILESLLNFIMIPVLPFAVCLGGRFADETYFWIGLILLFLTIHLAAVVARHHKPWLAMIGAVSFSYGCVMLFALIKMART